MIYLEDACYSMFKISKKVLVRKQGLSVEELIFISDSVSSRDLKVKFLTIWLPLKVRGWLCKEMAVIFNGSWFLLKTIYSFE